MFNRGLPCLVVLLDISPVLPFLPVIRSEYVAERALGAVALQAAHLSTRVGNRLENANADESVDIFILEFDTFRHLLDPTNNRRSELVKPLVRIFRLVRSVRAVFIEGIVELFIYNLDRERRV